ncbi:Germ cell-less protein-like 1 [Homalodisca vitripennis]|nr:Germ cell-less protein-like 1 [Homalodisca vitripennis]
MVDSSSFLLSPEGKDFLRVFHGLHMGSLITQEQDLQLLTQDRILPEGWLFPVLSKEWAYLLRIDNGNDSGSVHSIHILFFLRSQKLLGKKAIEK